MWLWLKSLFLRLLLRRARIGRDIPIIIRKNGYGNVGRAFTYQVEMTSTTNPPSTFVIDGLPSGLFYDVRTGLVSGIPVTAGTYGITIQVTNSVYSQSMGVQFFISP